MIGGSKDDSQGRGRMRSRGPAREGLAGMPCSVTVRACVGDNMGRAIFSGDREKPVDGVNANLLLVRRLSESDG